MIARRAEKLALWATLLAVLLILYMHVDYYFRHSGG
jgi:hypothetical protein